MFMERVDPDDLSDDEDLTEEEREEEEDQFLLTMAAQFELEYVGFSENFYMWSDQEQEYQPSLATSLSQLFNF